MISLLRGPPVLSLLGNQRFGPRVPNGTEISSNHMREICAKHELHAHRGGSTLRRQHAEKTISSLWDPPVVRKSMISLLWDPYRWPSCSKEIDDFLTVGPSCSKEIDDFLTLGLSRSKEIDDFLTLGLSCSKEIDDFLTVGPSCTESPL